MLVFGVILLSSVSDILQQKNPFWQKKAVRYVTYILLVGISGFLLGTDGSNGETTYSDTNSSSNSTLATESSTQESTIKKVNETLSTRYFDVTVNAVNAASYVKTGNSFADLPQEEGTYYLVLNTTFKNTSEESRMITDGEVLIYYNGKEYKFDKAETIMLEGWGLMFDQINPLTSKTTNLVYKIPSEITGMMYYRPGRSDKNDLIELGSL